MNASISLGGVAVCVVGVPGIGKSTLLHSYAGARPEAARHVVGSSIVKAVIAPATVRDLDGYAPERQESVRAEAIRRLGGIRRGFPGALLVDGHITLRNRVSRSVELVFTQADERFYDALVLLHGDATVVHAQRGRDERVREAESIDAIALHIDVERELARQVAARTRVPYVEIDASELVDRESKLEAFVSTLQSKVAPW